MRLKIVATTCIAIGLLMSTASSHLFADVILENSATGGDIGPFGLSGSQTYGQVFTAPITGTLDSFTIYLVSGVGELHGAVGEWNGPATFDTGYGESYNLYTSATDDSIVGGAYTFSPNVSVVAGEQYVAYLSVYGDSPTGSTDVALGTSEPGIGYFAWNHSGDPQNDSAWDYGANVGNLRFSASFSPITVPEPSSLTLLGMGAGVLGLVVVRRRRRAKRTA
ncbi:PEP-CTERM sorting domain-containing protein [Blastopirellula retiformator]|uniref:PEP-CTERM motif protein n=1 Tax=Blastopirellula retiformator TaxID=2527970 RepID=A0A5C5V7D6_9BACT|nr:PEP-CTERM sorting domain-containing protein [Blastopirellula retiformator]TWT34494.1 PEP-CTERM motif protein [Blastopirellula retiformator]